MDQPLIIAGPTAVGKSALALRLALDLDGEIVNADSLQVYRGFDVGTAKPSQAERRRVRHHLIDFLDPREQFSAGEFSRRAKAVVPEILGRGKTVIIVGGSGLYLRALIDGISPVPSVPSGIRRELKQRLAEMGPEALFADLATLDPELAQRLRPGDTQRVLRGLEVARATGRPLSSWQQESLPGIGGSDPYEIGLTLPRSLLYDRIASRVQEMIRKGWVDEVRALMGNNLCPGTPASQAIGYEELASVVSSRLSLAEAVEMIVRRTRRYAKRQLTWFRARRCLRWFDQRDPESAYQEILKHVGLYPIGRVQ